LNGTRPAFRSFSGVADSVTRLARVVAQCSRSHAAATTWLAASGIFLFALAIRVVHLSQPLVENFIDRQVHTAMMARNLARGASWLRPEIDIGPFPAYYMLEFPGFPALAAVVASMTGLPLDMAGRLLSALSMAAACVFLFDLVRRNDGMAVAFVAASALAAMPVTIRYGRGFQPDSLMFALLVAGVWSMGRWSTRGFKRDLAIAAAATSGALLLKVISAYVLVPMAYLAWQRCGRTAWRRWELWIAVAVIAIPSAAWYVHAWHVASSMTTVSTTFWQADKWIALGRFAQIDTYRQLAYFVGWRVLTPVGVALAIVGAFLRVVASRLEDSGPKIEELGSRVVNEVVERSSACHGAQSAILNPRTSPLLFHVWLASLALYFPILVRKVDHEHYYLALAPAAAVFIARALVALAAAPLATRCYVTGKQAAAALGVALVATDALSCQSTFRAPREWRHVMEASAAARELTPPDSLVVAHSSVLYYADRRGFAMDYSPSDVAYLLSTFGQTPAAPTANDLVEFYRGRGATHFVELLGMREHSDALDLLRLRYRVVREAPGQFIVVALDD